MNWNPFEIILVATIFMLFVAGVFAAIAPSLGITMPTAPTTPTLHVSSSTDWLTAIGNYLGFFGEILIFGLSYLGYMLALLGLVISFFTLGFIPSSIGGAVIVLIGILFVGSLAMYLRGNSGSK